VKFTVIKLGERDSISICVVYVPFHPFVFLGKLIEPLWGTREMLLFFGIVNVAVVIFCVSYYLFLYAITFDPAMLFEVKIHGLSGYIAAVAVTVRQIMPDHVLLRTPLGKITNR